MQTHSKRTSRFLCALVIITLATSAVAQQPSSQDVVALLKRIDELEQRVKTLEAQKTESIAPASAPVAEELTPVMAHQMGASPDKGFGHMTMRGFADVGWIGTKSSGTSTNSFVLGQFDLFISSRLSDRMSVIAETVFEADDKNNYGVDLERLLLNYQANDYFDVSVGRYHTAIGYYNTAYHH